MFASAVGLMFDRENYDKSITPDEREAVYAFFESLGFGTANVEDLAVDVDIPYGDLLKTVTFGNRWAYSGSLTTPPCTQGVYF